MNYFSCRIRYIRQYRCQVARCQVNSGKVLFTYFDFGGLILLLQRIRSFITKHTRHASTACILVGGVSRGGRATPLKEIPHFHVDCSIHVVYSRYK